MSTSVRKVVIAASIAAAGFLLPACAHHVTGTPAASHTLTPITATTTTAAPVPADVPSAPAPTRTATSDWVIDFNTTPGMSTTALFRMSVDRAQAFWSSTYDVSTSFDILAENHSLVCPDGEEHRGDMAEFCGNDPQAVVFQPSEVGKVRSGSYPDVTVAIIAAHEVGHAVENAKRYDPPSDSAWELGAECFAGAYIRADGVSSQVAKTAFARSVSWERDHAAHERAFADGYTSSDPLTTCTSY